MKKGFINKIVSITAAALVVAILTMTVGIPSKAAAAMNPQINYQGKLTAASTSVAVPNAGYNIRFKLYNTPTGGSPLWTETWCYSPDSGTTCDGSGVDNRVTITSGLFSTMLGSTTALTGVDFNQKLYLGVEIGSTTTAPNWDGEMTPRKVLGAVPAAMTANALNGLSSSQFLRSDATNSTNTPSNFLTITQNGTGTVAQFYGTSSTPALEIAANGNVSVGSTSAAATFSVKGSGSINPFVVASSSGAQLLTLLTDGSFGIGSSTPTARLSVAGISTSPTATLFDVASSTFASYFRVLSNGNVGVGTTSPVSTFAVAGNTTLTGTITLNSLASVGSPCLTVGTAGLLATSTCGGNSGNSAFTFGSGFIYNATSTDSVAIGSTTAIATLNVKGNAAVNPFIVASSTGTQLLTLLTNGNLGLGSTTALARLSVTGVSTSPTIPLFDVSSSTFASYFRILSSGNVGVGTTSPLALFSVAGQSYADYFTSGTTTGTTTIAGNFAINNGSLNYDYASGVTSIDSLQLGAMNFDTDAGIISWVDLPISAAAAGLPQSYTAFIGGNPALTVYGESNGASSSQNVRIGIASTTPIATLSIVGTSSTPVFVVASSTGAQLLTLAANGNLGISSSTPNARLSVAGVTTLPTATLFDVASSTFASYFRVLSSGNVGVGTTSPVSTFAVSGSATVSGSLTVNSLASVSNPCLTVGTAGLLATSTCINSTPFTVGNGFIYNATSTDSVAIGSTTAIATLNVRGNGAVNPFIVASSTGTQLLSLLTNGNLGLGSTTALARLSVAGISTSPTIPLFDVASSTFASFFRILSSGNVGVGTTSPLALFSVAGQSYADYFTSGTTTGTTTIAGNFAINNGSLNYDYASGVTSIDSLQLGAMNFDTDAGVISWVDLPISSSATVGTPESYTAYIGSQPVLTVYGEANGAGLPQNLRVGVGSTTPFSTFAITGSGSTTPFAVASSSGAQLFNVLATGRVGVGTSSPGATFAVSGIAGTTTSFLVASSSGAQLLTIIPDGSIGAGSSSPTARLSVAGVSTSPTAPLFDVASSTFASFFRVLSSGNVGVGTTSPVSTFAVSGSATVSGSMTINTLGSVGSPCVVVGTGGLLATSTCATGSGNSAFTIASGFIYNATSTDSVAIGSTTAIATLNVKGNAAVDPFIVASSTGTQLLSLLANGNLGLGSTTAFARLSVAGVSTSPTIPLFDVASSTFASYFRVLSNGNVGVGTTSPVALFSVAGQSYADYFTSGTTTGTTTIAGNFAVNSGSFNYDYASGVTNIDALQLGALDFDTDAGAVSWIDLPISSSASTGTVESYSASIGSQPLLTLYGEANGSGFSQNLRMGVGSTTPFSTFAITGSGSTTPFVVASSTGTQLLTLLTNGNLGVGSTTAFARLSVAGVSTSPTIPLFDVASSTFASYFRVLSSGNVGVGTTSPVSTFAVSGSATVSGSMTINSLASVSNPCVVVGTAGLLATSTCGGVSAGNAAFTIGNGFIYNATSTDSVAIGSTTAIATLNVKGNAAVNPFIVASSTGTQLLTLLANGNFGIGSSSPTARLSVTGISTLPTATLFDIASSSLTSFFNVTSSGFVGIGTSSPGSVFSLQGTSGFTGQLLDIASSSGATYLHIAANGYMGIGTSTPLGQLAINSISTLANDQVTITNINNPVTTAGQSNLQLNYYGGAGAVEASAQRIDLSPGTTAGGTWNGLRFVGNATGPGQRVTETAIKVESPSSFTNGGTFYGFNFSGTGSLTATGTMSAINIGNITGGSATETAMTVGTGWDTDLWLMNTAAAIQLAGVGSTSNVSSLTFYNGSTTRQDILSVKTMTQNFGGLVSSGAFNSRNSYFGEEFNKNLTDTTAQTTNAGGKQLRGDNGEITYGAKPSTSAASCTFQMQTAGANGFERINALGTASQTVGCIETLGSAAGTTTNNSPFTTVNLPVITLKASTTAIDSNHRYFLGISDQISATATMPTNGVFFSNCGEVNCAVGTFTNWNAVVKNGSSIATTSCGAAVAGKYAYMRIEGRATNEFHFFIDTNTSDGIVETECGTGLVLASNQSAMSMILDAYSGNATAAVLDVDYFRVWQDDNVIPEDMSGIPAIAEALGAEATSTATTTDKTASSTDEMATSTDKTATTSLEIILGVDGTTTAKTGILGGMMDMIKSLIERVDALAKTVGDLVVSMKNLTVDTLSAKKIFIEDGYEMKDSATGDIYCIRLAYGEFVKTKASCDGTTTVVASSTNSTTNAQAANVVNVVNVINVTPAAVVPAATSATTTSAATSTATTSPAVAPAAVPVVPAANPTVDATTTKTNPAAEVITPTIIDTPAPADSTATTPAQTPPAVQAPVDSPTPVDAAPTPSPTE